MAPTITEQAIIQQAINTCKDFATLSQDEKALLAQVSKVVKLKAESDVFAIEHQKKYFFIVHSGKQSLRLRRQVGYFKEGDLYGEITLFSEEPRLGTIHCLEDSTLVIVDKQHILQAGTLPDALRFKILHILGRKMAGYFYRDAFPPISEQIKQDEAIDLEFKADYSKDKKAREKIYETLVAFMNTQGGCILLGVTDTKKVVGIKMDKEFDKFRLDITNTLKSLTDKQTGDFLEVEIDKVNGKAVIRLIVKPAPFPIVFKAEGKRGLFVRQNGLNTYLSDANDIIRHAAGKYVLG